MSLRPVIGVPACRKEILGQPFHVVGEKYLQAVIDGADALPLMIPVMAEHLDIDEILGQVDGVFLTGSISNVEPHHYEGEPSEPGTLHDPHRDAATLPLTRRALDAGVPLMAVCRGFHELTVVLGGTLHQKVHEVEGYHNHKEDPDDSLEVQYGPSHAVNLIEGGRTPLCSLEELAELGFFSVGFVLSGLYAAALALDRTYREIRRAGTTAALGDQMMAFDEFNALIGVEQRFADDERYRA